MSNQSHWQALGAFVVIMVICAFSIFQLSTGKAAKYLTNFPYTVKSVLGEFEVKTYLTEAKEFREMPNGCLVQKSGTKITLLENKNIIQIDSAQSAIVLGCPTRFFLAENLVETQQEYSKAFAAAKKENDPRLEFTPAN